MIFLVIALILAPLNWYALRTNNNRLVYFSMPGVILSLLAWLLVFAQPFSSAPSPRWINIQWFVWALIFSLAGDVFLMLPRQKFIAGLVAFSLAHIAFIQGFALPIFPKHYAIPGVIISALVIAVSLRVYLPIARALSASGENKMKIPTAIYAVLITAMLIAAISTLVKGWGFASSFLAAGGGLMFYTSDIFLAWDRFVHPLPQLKITRRVLYHLGQISIITGAAFHFLGIA